MPVTTLDCPICRDTFELGAERNTISPSGRHSSMIFHLYNCHHEEQRNEAWRYWSGNARDEILPGGISTQAALDRWFVERNITIQTTTPRRPATMATVTRYYIGDEDSGLTGIIRERVTRERVAGAEKILESMAVNLGCSVVGAFKCGDRAVRLNVKNGYIVMSTQITKINLKTTFSVLNGHLVPMFTDEPDFLHLELPWAVPSNMKIIFAVKALPNQWRPEQACFFARIDGAPGNWRLPLPNIYNTGKICLGRTYEQTRCQTLQELMEKSLALLDNATWNTDLMEDGWRVATHSQQLFKFKADTREPVYHATPSALCVRVNSTVLEEAI